MTETIDDTIDQVLHTDAGAHLFNGITRMNLVDRNGNPVLFSKRKELARHMIGLLLEAGYRPESMIGRPNFGLIGLGEVNVGLATTEDP